MKLLSPTSTVPLPARHDHRPRVSRAPFPQSNYNFQPTPNDLAPASVRSTKTARPDLRAFRQLSGEFMRGETRRNHLVEMLVFAVVAGLTAWPLVSLLIVLAQTARG